MPLFNRLIDRLVFQLDKVIPYSALEAGLDGIFFQANIQLFSLYITAQFFIFTAMFYWDFQNAANF